MALKPTIYKINIALSDMDRGYYDSLNLIVARHASENIERMMVRILAFCINAQPRMAFTRGLSSPDEPDLWAKALDDQIVSWIDVGEPSLQRIKKASRMCNDVRIYCFNTRSVQWWKELEPEVRGLPVAVYQFEWQSVCALAGLAERTGSMSVSISDDSAFIASDLGECEVGWVTLQGAPLSV